MSFIFPHFLYALFAISIPIIIHLFNFRKYKKVYFTNVKFLRELKQESQSKSRLKELLILLSRILAITCLVLAFAQPVFVDKNAKVKTGDKAIGIYIDNSFSMEGINKNGDLLSNAKKRAKEIINAFGNADRFMLLSNDFEGKHQRLLSKEEILEALDDIKISSAVKPLSACIQRQSDFLKSSKAKDLRQFIISDFQKTTADFKNLKPDTTISSALIPIYANSNDNVFIDTCWFETPVQQKGMIQKLNIRINNKSKKNIENGTVKLFITQNQIGISSFNAEANSKAETKITFECKAEGYNYCSLKIDDYPIVFDDELFFTFNSKPNISVLVINGKNSVTGSYFKTLMENDSLFNYHENSEQAIDYGLFTNTNIIFLNEIETYSSGLISEINKFVTNGGHIVIIPAVEYNQESYTQFYKNLNLPQPGNADTSGLRIEKTDFKTGFYSGVFDKIDERMDLPLVKKRFTTRLTTQNNLQAILKLTNGEIWLGSVKTNGAEVYVFESSLDVASTNFCKHALFVPTLYKMAINSIKPFAPYLFTQSNSVINVNALTEKSEEPFHIRSLNNKLDIIPEMRVANNRLNIYTQNQINEPGFFNLTHKNEIKVALAFNYNRQESVLEFYNHDELEQLIADNHLLSFKNVEVGEKSLTSSIQEINGNIKLWKLFIILTLIFVAIEIALIRFLK